LTVSVYALPANGDSIEILPEFFPEMAVKLVNPFNGAALERAAAGLADGQGTVFPVIGGVPRIAAESNYAESFGKQWNQFRLTQIDRPDLEERVSEQRLFAETAWTPGDLRALDVLEVGSGAGRFSRVLLEHTEARLWSVDYSTAVDANMATNGKIAPERFHLFQASIYEMPFPDDSFDKVLCLGVLQHTPDFEQSVRALVAKAKPGAEIVVDFYYIRGFWTKIHAKYLVRPVTKRMQHERLLGLIERNVDWLLALSADLRKVQLGFLTRFIPLVDVEKISRAGLPKDVIREIAVLDTFDMLSPEYDNPQRIGAVARMFERSGAEVRFADFVDNGTGEAAVVRAVKRPR
jgi:SAM-dependent methyltransferase